MASKPKKAKPKKKEEHIEEKSPSKKVADFITSPRVLIPAVIILVLVLTYIGTESLERENVSKLKTQNYVEPFRMDNLSAGVFSYINDFRVMSNSSKLKVSEDAYDVAITMVKMKGYDSSMFRQVDQIVSYVGSTKKFSDYRQKYTVVYETKGPSVVEFKNAFNEKYRLKPEISADKYESGAVGCDGNYCVVILLGNESIELRKDF